MPEHYYVYYVAEKTHLEIRVWKTDKILVFVFWQILFIT